MKYQRDYSTFKNKYGHFSRNGREFVITRPDTPRPWTNIICNGDFGLAVSQAGGGFTWRTHVSLNRLNRWNQDLIQDNWGKWLYLRDIDNGDMRSLAFQPVQAPYDHYEARHGLGYTTFNQRHQGLESHWTLFAAKDDPVEIWLVTLKNSGQRKRRLQLSSYFEWNLGIAPDNHREFHKLFIDTLFDEELNALVATKLIWEVPTERGHWNTDWPYIGFHAVSETPSAWDTSKDSLVGRHGSIHRPRGIQQGQFTRQYGRFQDAAASLAVDINLAPGEQQTLVFVLGQGEKQQPQNLAGQVEKYIRRYCHVNAAEEELQKVQAFWQELTQRVQIETPNAALDLLSNTWMKYQAISGHLWGRTAYYQQSGAYGFRDQLQTSQVWLSHEPDQMLEQVKLNARHQFSEGKVLHWWHPLIETGLATDMTDDLLWLPFMLNRYFVEINDYSALQEIVSYYDEGEGSLQEHCVRAINVVLERFSSRGLPLIGAGDWCDGFSAVGLDWKGESIWLGMFLYGILLQWAEILEKYSAKPDRKTADSFLQRAENLKIALNTHGWNGQWYICATKDDGTPMGDPSQAENKIYLNSQTWAIMHNVANRERKKQVADAFLEHLEGDNGTMLFQPGYSKPDKFIGYITRYAPGLRENGGVYTHAATWSIMALAQLKRPQDAMRLFDKLNPILQTEADVDRYSAEPYVLPGNIDGKDSPYYGRAGWTWYTGSTGWLYTIVHEWICGVRPVPEGLLLDPCIPSDWEQVTVKRKFRGASYDITIENPDRHSGGIREISVNGQKFAGNVIPQQSSGEHVVTVRLVGH